MEQGREGDGSCMQSGGRGELFLLDIVHDILFYLLLSSYFFLIRRSFERGEC